jgi:transcriptional regulator with XRE-family HTH domain
MHQSEKFLAALKRCLKAKGISYKDLSSSLKISETSVKRVFSEGTLSLDRIGEILDILNMSFLDVAKLVDNRRGDGSSILTFDQESVLAADAKLFAFFNLLLFGRSVDDICRTYTLSKRDAEQYIRTLCDLDLAMPQGENQVKMLTKKSVRWLEKGPLRDTYGARIRDEFLNGDFTGESEISTFRTRSLSAGSRAAMRRKIDLLMIEMDELAAIDTAILKSPCRSVSFVVGFRPFAFSSIEALRKRPVRVAD